MPQSWGKTASTQFIIFAVSFMHAANDVQESQRKAFFALSERERERESFAALHFDLTLNLPTTTIVAQPFNVIKWQLKFNPVA